MNTRIFWAIAIAASLAACSEQPPTEEPATSPPPAEEPATSPPPAEPEAVAEPASAGDPPRFDAEFIDHMHAHAERVDEMMYALDDGDLDDAMVPAFWLSRHNTVEGVPEEWQPFVTGMRESARAVEEAEDLETARAAAEGITAHCQGCHAAAGIIVAE